MMDDELGFSVADILEMLIDLGEPPHPLPTH